MPGAPLRGRYVRLLAARLVSRLDRFGRSLKNLVTKIDHIDERGVEHRSLPVHLFEKLGGRMTLGSWEACLDILLVGGVKVGHQGIFDQQLNNSHQLDSRIHLDLHRLGGRVWLSGARRRYARSIRAIATHRIVRRSISEGMCIGRILEAE